MAQTKRGRSKRERDLSRSAVAWMTYESVSILTMRLDVTVLELERTLNARSTPLDAGLEDHERLNLVDILHRLRTEQTYLKDLCSDLAQRVKNGPARP